MIGRSESLTSVGTSPTGCHLDSQLPLPSYDRALWALGWAPGPASGEWPWGWTRQGWVRRPKLQE